MTAIATRGAVPNNSSAAHAAQAQSTGARAERPRRAVVIANRAALAGGSASLNAAPLVDDVPGHTAAAGARPVGAHGTLVVIRCLNRAAEGADIATLTHTLHNIVRQVARGARCWWAVGVAVLLLARAIALTRRAHIGNTPAGAGHPRPSTRIWHATTICRQHRRCHRSRCMPASGANKPAQGAIAKDGCRRRNQRHHHTHQHVPGRLARSETFLMSGKPPSSSHWSDARPRWVCTVRAAPHRSRTPLRCPVAL